MSDTQPLGTTVRRLAEQRAKLAEVTATYKARKDAFDAENAALVESKTELAAEVAGLESAAKVLAVNIYRESGLKKPVAGVEVKSYKVMVYDEAKALEWAREKGICLVPARLDVPAFEKIAPTLGLDFVLHDEEPRATIAKDLSTHLAIAEVTAPAASSRVAVDDMAVLPSEWPMPTAPVPPSAREALQGYDEERGF